MGIEESTLSRYFDNLEEANYRANKIVSTVIEYQGSIDESALSEAYRCLCTRYPVLRANVETENHPYLLRVLESDFPEFIVVDSEESSWLSQIDNLTTGTHPRLTYLFLARGASKGFIVFGIDHAIADGGALTVYLSELWQLYTDRVEGNNTSRHICGVLPDSPTGTARRLCGRIPGRVRAEASKTGTSDTELDNRDGPGIPVRIPAKTEIIQLNPAETAGLIATSKRHKISVGSVLTGAMLSVVRCRNQERGTVPITFEVVADLRKRPSPPVRPTAVTNFFTIRRVTVGVEHHSQPIVVATDVDDESRKAKTREEEFFSKTRTDDEIQELLEGIGRTRPGAAFHFNHAGAFPRWPSPAGVSLNAFGGTALAANGQTEQLSSRNIPHSIRSYTFEGRLTLLWTILSSAYDESLRERYITSLREISTALS